MYCVASFPTSDFSLVCSPYSLFASVIVLLPSVFSSLAHPFLPSVCVYVLLRSRSSIPLVFLPPCLPLSASSSPPLLSLSTVFFVFSRLLVCGLSLAFIRPENAMRSKLGNGMHHGGEG